MTSTAISPTTVKTILVGSLLLFLVLLVGLVLALKYTDDHRTAEQIANSERTQAYIRGEWVETQGLPNGQPCWQRVIQWDALGHPMNKTIKCGGGK